MAEECVITTFEATKDNSRSRSGSTSGSSDSDVSPICKISPLVVPVTSTSPRPLTPKKRHRAEMELELRRQEEALRAEEAKPAVKEATSPAVDVKSGVETKPEKELPMKKRNSELKEQMTSKTKNESKDEKPAVPAKESKTKTTSNVEAEITSTPKKFKPDGTKPAKRSTTPKKSPAAKSPKEAAKSPGGGDDGDEVAIPEGWRRVATQRMQGVSAGKVDVYYWSPTGKKFRSRPQILSYLEEIGSSLSVENFNFRQKGANASPARFKSPAAEKKKKVTPKAKAKESPKKTKKKTKPLGRPRKNSGGKSPAKKTPAKKSPAKKLVKGKQQRKVMKPPPDTGSKKASRAQQLQKLLVKINFQKPGDIREMSSDESSEVSEDDFDPGTTEEVDNTSEISVTPSPPPTKKMRRHSSPID